MNNTFFSTEYNRVLGTVALVLVIAALGAYAYYTIKQAQYIYTGPTTISVTGEGEAVSVPDIARFSFTVTEKGSDTGAAQNGSAAKMNEIVSALKEAGVEEKDIKTEYYNMYPVFKYEEARCPVGSFYCPPGNQIEDGYEVSQNIAVKVRDLAKSGALLALVGEKGATNISGLEFTIDDTSVLEDEARAAAITDAKAKAVVLAKELDVRLNKMVGYYEDEGYPVTPYYGMGGDAMMKSSAVEEAVVPTGENTITSRVTLTYQIR